MKFQLDVTELEKMEKDLSIEEIQAIAIPGTTGNTEGAASVGSTLPVPPYFWFTCSA
ncbi:hypothetical protein [Desmospora activa]|uniref:hypothetical protein n=1 Tax=Desmospora activa TaxID=500615 RepID=UPI001475847E|nr:hypothetical protein [Desmospora activa]